MFLTEALTQPYYICIRLVHIICGRCDKEFFQVYSPNSWQMFEQLCSGGKNRSLEVCHVWFGRFTHYFKDSTGCLFPILTQEVETCEESQVSQPRHRYLQDRCQVDRRLVDLLVCGFKDKRCFIFVFCSNHVVCFLLYSLFILVFLFSHKILKHFWFPYQIYTEED